MFAIIRAGGKQYKVAPNDKLKIELVDAKEGDNIDCEVLFGEGGKGATVSAKVIGHGRNDKVVIFKKKRRQNYRRTRGHKQHHTIIQITDIKAA